MKCDHTLHLSDICDYVKDKIAITALNRNNYVSTENMLANKAGIVRASSLPAVAQTQAFLSGDVLVSNIRPYFKKIWFAKFDGGCSNDVLVFRAKEGVSSRFLYYVLANDSFFAYSTATSKGTKMPRGDKTAIMGYEVPKITPEEQEKITAILSALDDKIELNNKINANLEQQAQALFKAWFEDVSPERLPFGWRFVTLGEVVTISKRIFSPSAVSEMQLEHYSIPAFDEGRFPVFEPSTSVKSNKFIVDKECFMISKLNPTTKRVWRPYCLSGTAVCSTEFIVYKAKDVNMTDFLYSVIDSVTFSDFMCSHVTGSTGSRQRTNPSETLAFELVVPSDDKLLEFQSIVASMYAQIRTNAIESDRLRRIRDVVLPKLMSGEIV